LAGRKEWKKFPAEMYLLHVEEERIGEVGILKGRIWV
jgi:hypothetical protein